MSTRKPTIVVADDDPRQLRLVQRTLELEGFRVLTASDGSTALKMTEAEEPDLLVLDVMMPGLDGFELCRRVREFSSAGIIVLTAARLAEEDKVSGLNWGADDYVTKPYGSRELVARVKAVLRRTRQEARQATPTVVACGELKVDFAQHLAYLGGRPLNLTPIEYRILSFLARNVGRVVTQQDLLTRVWGPEYKDESHLLRVNIARLRQKVEPTPSRPRYILTRPGIGYALAAPEAGPQPGTP